MLATCNYACSYLGASRMGCSYLLSDLDYLCYKDAISFFNVAFITKKKVYPFGVDRSSILC